MGSIYCVGCIDLSVHDATSHSYDQQLLGRGNSNNLLKCVCIDISTLFPKGSYCVIVLCIQTFPIVPVIQTYGYLKSSKESQLFVTFLMLQHTEVQMIVVDIQA